MVMVRDKVPFFIVRFDTGIRVEQMGMPRWELQGARRSEALALSGRRPADATPYGQAYGFPRCARRCCTGLQFVRLERMLIC
ncbi:hypothetical protein KC361_g83 [Hortaea werneckii]|nr:hypothetical protein KC361_g83 [Hortaea werneckii]